MQYRPPSFNSTVYQEMEDLRTYSDGPHFKFDGWQVEQQKLARKIFCLLQICQRCNPSS